MKTVEMVDATAPLSEYARQARRHSVVVMRRGKPMAAVVPLNSANWEDFVVGQHPGFLKVMKRSEASYKAEGGISLEELQRKYAPTPKAPRKATKTARRRSK